MKHLYTTIVFTFCCHLIFAQTGFVKQSIIDSTFVVDNPSSLVSVDFDSDGDLDLLVASNQDDKVSWLENLDGLGTFSQLQLLVGTVDSPVSALAHDMDGDTDLDLIIASTGDEAIVWYENVDGLGNLGNSQQIATGLSGLNLNFTVADLDNDNDLDVISSSGSTISWFENIDGLGSFGSEVVLDSNSYSTHVIAEDMDADGDLDILFSQSNSELRWLDNLNSNATTWTANDISTIADGIIDVVVADIDGINGVDLVISSSINNKLFWCQNDGSNNFDSGQQLNTISGNAKGVAVADINGDTFLDVISVAGSEVSYYQNTDGLGAFSDQQIISTAINDGEIAVASDLTGNGFMDVVSASSIDNKIAWYQNIDELGNFSSQQLLSHSVEGLKSIYKADLDGDGDLDVLSVSNYGVVYWYEFIEETETFDVPKVITELDEDFETIYAEDLDGDGDMDVITGSYYFNSIKWFENLDGLGTFSSANLITDTLSSVTSMSVFDVDGDNDNDVVALSFFDGKLVWFENTDGTGNFGSENVLESGMMTPQEIFKVDFDNDNDLDILLSFRNTIQWYENTNGSFSAPNIITTSLSNNHFINVEDIDGDGDTDVLSASSNAITWFENTNSLGDFSDEILISNAFNNAPKAISAGDFDADGDVDVISSQDNNISWFENVDGLGTFGDEIFIENTYTLAKQFLIEDVDSNNAVDVITLFSEPGNNDFKVVWYDNKIVTNTISGQVLYEANGNCDANALVVPNQMVSTTSTIDGVSSFTNVNGFYENKVYEGDFTTQLEGLAPYFDYSPLTYASNYDTVNNLDVFNFCIEANTVVNDLNIAVYPSIDDPRPGFITTYELVYSNVGTTAQSGTVTFEFDDSKLQFASASETATTITNNTLAFDFIDLNPFETRTIALEFIVFAPPTTNIDDVLISTAAVNPIAGDFTEDDNTFNLEQTVIGSYDPNDIAVLEGDEISIDDTDNYLHYVIRFQNTGNASAINVKVDNVLDDKLDWTTLQVESLSHNGRVEIINQTNVSFIFDAINLPDMFSDEPNSHGFITYKIKPKNDVVLGDIFYNTADIFFDFNPAITTNTVSTEIVNTLSLEEFETNVVTVYPNPSKSNLTITTKFGFDYFTIVDINGRVLNTFTNEEADLSKTIDIEALANGIYFLNLKSLTKQHTVKFIKN
ncbi:T9SS type A sorting domain-containing protein [Psychroserpens damuponensis]|uniref:T9SS type A sorting domain-containing protein n=1 Tax=Psychroserpens damuponensis TaxID=943936 RepID=UPI00058C44D5|nr:T9SS type A sorting domain-containing protein [Psychroserpens damuponensis]